LDGQGNEFKVTSTVFSKSAAVYVTSSILFPKDAFLGIEGALTYYNLTTLAGKLATAATGLMPAVDAVAACSPGWGRASWCNPLGHDIAEILREQC
jgi:hypothetical protein